MFDDVQRWAGTHSTSDKNLGVECAQIHPRLFEAFDQIAHKTFPPDEIAVRFHHARSSELSGQLGDEVKKAA
jgi:hypothetical protein